MSKAYADADYIVKEAHLGLDFSGVDPATINDLAEVASRIIDNFTQNIFCRQTITAEKKSAIIDVRSRIIIRTQFKPIVSVSKLEIAAIPTERITIDLNRLDIHHKQGFIRVYSLSAGGTLIRNIYDLEEWNTEIDYIAGPESTPSPIKRACALIVRNMLRPGELSSGVSENSSSNKGTLTKIKSMSYEEQYAQVGGAASGIEMSGAEEDNFLITSDIRTILIPYCKRGVL